MIKISELRIGNWVQVNGKPIKVQSIDDTGINGIDGGIGYGMDYDGRFLQFYKDQTDVILSIPLTPEILGACGLTVVKEHSIDPLCIEYGTLMDEDGDCDFHIQYEGSICYFMWHGDDVALTSLHQLQNLYFALVGEELNVKL